MFFICPSPKICFVQNLVEIGTVVLEKIFKFCHFHMYFHYFVIISPWTWARPPIWTNINPLHPRMFMQRLVEIGPAVLEKKMNIWKVYDNDDNDDGQRTNFDQKSLLEPSAQVSLKIKEKYIYILDLWLNLVFNHLSLISKFSPHIFGLKFVTS